MKLYESAEDYLERILMLEETIGMDMVHSVDLASSFGYSKASISVAMKKLREDGYLSFGKNDAIILSDKGREIAITMYERHRFLTKWLLSLGVDEATAKTDACKIEHDISEETFVKLKEKIGG